MSASGPQASLASYLALPLAVALPAAAAIFMLWDIAFLDNDAAQYLSVARNILDGNGIASSILFYEEQLAPGRVPAPQTVFPPGMSVVLAAFLAAGVETPTAILAAGVLGYVAIGIVLVVLLRRFAVGPLLAFLGATIWLAQGTAWANVMLGGSEIVYTLATLLSAATLLTAGDRRSRFVLAGALAGGAVLVRYQGLFFVVALGAWCAWTWLRTPAGQRLRFSTHAAALLVSPLAAGAFLLVRNLLLTGSPGGGPIDTVDWSGAHGLDIARSAYWALIPFLGLSLDGLSQFRWQEIAVAAGFLVLAAWLVRNARAHAPAPGPDGDRSAREAYWRLAICYIVVTCLALASLATRSTGYLQGRFLLPLVPFVAVAWIILLDRVLKAPMARARAALFVALLALHGGLFAGQVRVLQYWLETLRADQRIAMMHVALGQDVAGSTLEQFLRSQVSIDAPLLATGGQLLWLLLELPVVETTPAGFSYRTWDEAELRHLNRCLGVRYLLYIPGVFDPQRPENRNQPLYQRLARGADPAGMTPILRLPEVRLYEFEPMDNLGAQVAQDRGNDDCN